MSKILHKLIKFNRNSGKFEYDWDEIMKIPEFIELEKCQQNPRWHGEGNALEHTKLVCNQAIENLSGSEQRVFLASALFHDIGKTTTTKLGKDGNYHSYGHEFEGEKITRRILWDEDVVEREHICALVRLHMEVLHLYESKNLYEKLVLISRSVPSMRYLINLKRCDILGSLQLDNVGKIRDLRALCRLDEICSNMGILEKKQNMPSYQTHEERVKTQKLVGVGIVPWVRVMIGLPGSGKDTFIKKIYEDTENVVVCRDDIRAELGLCKDGEKIVASHEDEEIVSKIFNERVIEAIKAQKSVIINNINLKRKYRDSLKNLLKDYNVKYEYIYVQAPSLSENIARREGQVDSDVFNKMIENFDWPSPEEYDKLYCYSSIDGRFEHIFGL